jgi:hypothetical protein
MTISGGEEPQRILNPQYVGEEVSDVHVFLTPEITLASLCCPHSVFMCFVWIWQQTAIISQYGFDWLIL